MGTWVVGDIHGCYNEWKLLETKVGLVDPNPTFILVGDIIDRGNKQIEMLRWAMSNITENGKYQMIIGNHEFEKIEWFFKYNDIKERNNLDTLETMIYDRYKFDFVMRQLEESERQEVFQFFLTLPYYKELYVQTKTKQQHYIIVHSTIPESWIKHVDGKDIFDTTEIDYYKNNTTSLSNYKKNFRIAESVVWNRRYYGYDFKDTIVVHGHTPTLSSEILFINGRPGKVFYSNNDINVDCGCVYSMQGYHGNLVALRLEDLTEVYLNDAVQDSEDNDENEDDICIETENPFNIEIDQSEMKELLLNKIGAV